MGQFIKLIVSASYLVAEYLASLLFGGRTQRLIVLYYHAVSPQMRRRFSRQLNIIQRCAPVVRADFQGSSDGPRRLIAITFDDAFQSVVDVAIPELATRGMPVTIFVPSGALGGSPNWKMEMEVGDRNEIVVTSEVLRSVISPLVTIGAHSVSHPHLTQLKQDSASAEITRCKRDLEEMFDTPVQLFAFPYGDFNAQTVKLCREAGYKYAFTIGPELIDLREDKFLRGRIAVNPTDSALEFWLKVRGAYTWMGYASSLKQKFFGRSHDSAQSNLR